MARTPGFWDYLVLTASNDAQARAYEAQLAMRRETGHLVRVRETMVVADLEGKRIGSGASTLDCLARIVAREGGGGASPAEVLGRLRILIIHAGGDSRRLPAYSPCGKIFVPVPGESHAAFGLTLFDLLAPAFLALPSGEGAGQVLVTAGDALNRFDASGVSFGPGMTLLGAWATPEEASRHGVFCVDGADGLRLYIQKPSLAEQAATGAINAYGQAVLDIGITNLDGASAAALLDAFHAFPEWEPAMRERILCQGLDLYREICCAMGREATFEHYARTARASGSRWDEDALAALFPALQRIPVRAGVLPGCAFLHFGSTRELVSTGVAVAMQDRLAPPGITALSVNNEIANGGGIAGAAAWVEGCRLSAPLTLAGHNVVTGADVNAPLALPERACLNVVEGAEGFFVECYGIDDSFKDARFCGRPLAEWLAAVGASPRDIWRAGEEPILWNARVFPNESEHEDFRRWLWMYAPETATAEQKRAWLAAERHSAAEIALLARQENFYQRRAAIRAAEIRQSLNRMFAAGSPFSAEDLAFALRHAKDRAAWVDAIRERARELENGPEPFLFCRMVHSLGSALAQLGEPERGAALRAQAFRHLHESILRTSLERGGRPRNALRPDETIWGRGPARIELAGGWTDTPPYTLEHGGDVVNAAVNLNGQPPIHCYCRIVDEPVIRLGSIDGGIHLEIRSLEELLDYRRPEDRFALAKAALAISGFSPEMADWPAGVTLPAMLEEFGGGIELTTLVGIPKGSGLGTSSILGAVILAVIRRMTGAPSDQRALFHDVLRLEQALTTGGGWQDQIGGGVGGTKITSTRPGMIPDPSIHYVPSDVLDPNRNGGSTLLYYTGMTRLAKNILEEIVGGYFNRNRAIMAALEEEHMVAHNLAGAMSRKDAAAFGHYVNVAWELQKRLCGAVTNEAIETLLARVRPHVHGMRISGAGSGGFLLMICKSPADAVRVREKLEREPINDRARFFDFQINEAGLEVTTC